MTLFGQSFGVLQPFLVALLPLSVGALIYAYRRGGKGRELIVSSVIFLKQLSTQTRNKRKFFPPPRFFLELILLTMLSGAAIGIYQQGFDNKVAILIDNSLSMSAMSSRGVDSLSKIEIAKRDAAAYLGSMGFGTGADVYQTSPVLKKITPEGSGTSEAQRRIEKITTYYGPDNLPQAISQIAETEPYSKIVVLSDRVSDTSTETPFNFLYLNAEDVSTPEENIAIIDGTLSESISNRDHTFNLTVASYSKQESNVELTLQLVDLINDQPTFQEIKKVQLSFLGGEIKRLTYEIPPAEGYIAKIENKSLGVKNSLSADDQTYFASSKAKEEISLVSALSPDELGLSKINNFSAKWTIPERYSPSTDNGIFTIFHNFVPDTIPTHSVLIVNPSNNGPYYTVSPEEVGGDRSLEITSWLENDPITTYLNLPTLKLKRTRILYPERGAKTIVSSELGGIVLSHQDKTARSVATGFELFPFKGRESPLLSILTLNIFKWLSGTALNKGYEELPYRSKASGSILKVNSNDESSEPSIESISTPGLFRITKDGVTSLVAINYLSSAESDTLNQQSFDWPQKSDSSIRRPTPQDTYSPSLLLLGLFILLADLAYLFIKQKRRQSI